MSEPILEFKGRYHYLSNFFEGAPIVYRHIEVRTGEHLFNALKTWSTKEANYVMSAPTPGEAKQRGRHVTLKENWDETERFRAMRHTISAKFFGNTGLGLTLVDTDDALLVEGNTWHDQVWGNCTCGRPECADEGQNHLGKLLMEIRGDLRKWVL